MSTINTIYIHDVCFTASVTIMYQFKSNEKSEVYVLWDALKQNSALDIYIYQDTGKTI